MKNIKNTFFGIEEMRIEIAEEFGVNKDQVIYKNGWKIIKEENKNEKI